MDYGHHEALAVFGADPRSYSIRTLAFEGDAEKNVTAVKTVEVDKTVAGIVDVANTSRTWPAQLILLAMGFVGPPKDTLLAELSLTLNERGTIAADANKMTCVPGVFAAGDMERGQSLVVWAIADGRKAAQGVNAFLIA